MYFLTQTYLSPSQKSLYHRQPHVNEIAVTDTDEAHSNTQDGMSGENINVIDLLTIFRKSPIPDTLSDPDFFSIWVFFHEHSRITGLQRKGEVISLIPYYHFHPLHRHLDISRAITAGSKRNLHIAKGICKRSLHIASSRTRTGNLWFPCTSR